RRVRRNARPPRRRPPLLRAILEHPAHGRARNGSAEVVGATGCGTGGGREAAVRAATPPLPLLVRCSKGLSHGSRKIRRLKGLSARFLYQIANTAKSAARRYPQRR